MKDSNQIRLELSQVRSRLIAKAVPQPVKSMIKKGLWTKTKQDHNYLLGRTLNIEFLEALKKLDNLLE